MNQSKRKRLARIDKTAKAQKVVKVEELTAQPVVETVAEQPVAEAPAAVVEEALAPVVSNKKKKS